MTDVITNETPNSDNHSDIHRLTIANKELVLIGTAHISKESAQLVRQVIEEERPDCVCIELDEKRYESLSKRKSWVSLNLKEIIYRKQLSTLLANLVLASYQKKLGDQLGIQPGTELLEAAKAAEAQGIPVSLCDRDVRVTMRRAWKSTSIWKKGYLMASLLTSLFDDTEITEEKLSEMRKSDVISELMEELGQSLPELKRVLIDERDTFLSEKIKATDGAKIVAVVGAGHVAGIKLALTEDRSGQMAEINAIPPVSKMWKILGWSIPAIIIASIIAIGFRKGGSVAGDNIIYWILANGIPSSIGAMLALAHPLTIVGAFIAAPLTSLTPVIGAGYVTAFLQVILQPPVVSEFESALDDMSSLTGWWRNKLLRVFLTFILPGFGSMIGTYIGGYKIISSLF
ncbi:MAG: TraB/GumN family protein [Desulfobulbaceae bacterium]|nr:TraB/GumN family protein [Desulfobulbaceae bacterium]